MWIAAELLVLALVASALARTPRAEPEELPVILGVAMGFSIMLAIIAIGAATL